MLLHLRVLLKIFVCCNFDSYLNSQRLDLLYSAVEDEQHFLIECPSRIVRAIMFLAHLSRRLIGELIVYQ